MSLTNNSKNMYEAVVAITDDYLGPASERFVDRHIRNHLNKEPSDLISSDMPELIKWIQATIAVITEDRDMIANYISDLKNLHKTCEASS